MKRFIHALIEENGYQATRLLHILRKIQSRYHHIPTEAIEQTAELLQIPRPRILSVIEFYSFFHLHPRGQYEILISDSITDQMLGKHRLMDYIRERLSVNIGVVRDDGLVSLDNTSCTGMCDQGPAGLVNGYALTRLNTEKIDQMADLIEQQKPLEVWPAEMFRVEDNIKKAGLLLAEKMLPGDSIKAAFSRGLSQTLTEIDSSGLRGRGGAGFKTATKWRFCAEGQHAERYVVCNADEGEPGTFKDRVLLNTYAHQVFEGMTLCASTIAAQQGFLYLRGEYLYLYDKLQSVLEERRNAGLLGNNILAEGLNFDIEICLGAGAYICGEESALIESLEGKCGIPRIRPPYPVSHGYLDKPTVVDNVETFLAAAHIVIQGGDGFASVGTEKSSGTKVLSISGDCLYPGIYEYSFGTTVKEILNDCGATDVLGIQVGGPSGTFICNKEFERKLGFEDLSTGGSFIVFNNSRNVLEIVQNFTRFFAHESCGFCTPCRVGTSLLAKAVDNICMGRENTEDEIKVTEISNALMENSLCGLGQTAANPILTTLERYPDLLQCIKK